VEIIGYSLSDLSLGLNAFETDLQDGESVKVQLCTEVLPTEQELADIYLEAAISGHHINRPTSYIAENVAVTEFALTKGSPALALLAAIDPAWYPRIAEINAANPADLTVWVDGHKVLLVTDPTEFGADSSALTTIRAEAKR